MSRQTDAFKNAFVALGFGESAKDYKGQTVIDVLKELAVHSKRAKNVSDVKGNTIDKVLNFIAETKPAAAKTETEQKKRK